MAAAAGQRNVQQLRNGPGQNRDGALVAYVPAYATSGAAIGFDVIRGDRVLQRNYMVWAQLEAGAAGIALQWVDLREEKDQVPG